MLRRVSGSARAAALLCLGLACMAASEVGAHRRSADGNFSGIPIAALSHGQMAVISDYRGEILDLAARESRTDETFRRLLNFGSIQYAYCLWGLVPGSLKDETSPFNECSHAYLSAARELLAYMRNTSANKQAVEDLISQIDADMVRQQASFVQCQYSSEAFNTAGLVYPAWDDVPSHLPSLVAFAGLAVTAAAGSFALGGGFTRRSGGAKH